METLTNLIFTQNNLKDVLGKSSPSIEGDVTGLEFEDKTYYLYAFIDNQNETLEDIGFMVNNINTELSEEQKEIVRLHLVSFYSSEYSKTA